MLEIKRMERENEKWIKSMKDRLDKHAEPVPEGLWDTIEQEISSKALSPSLSWKRMISVAAVVFMVLASVSVWIFKFSEKQSFQEIASYTKQISEVSKKAEIDPVSFSSDLNPEKSVVAKLDRREVHLASILLDSMSVNSGISAESVEKQDEENHTESDTLPVYKNPSTIVDARKQTQSSIKPNKKEGKYVRHAKQKKSNWGIGLMYANSLGVHNNAFPGYSTLDFADYSQVKEPLHDDMSMPQMNKAPQKGPIPASSNSDLPKTEIKHKLPVTAGLSFRYYINSRFAIETGLNYTLLSSELRAGTHDEYYIEEYKFHYLGIPLKASWTFLDIPYLSLYVSAGGEMEKSLAGKYKKQYVSKNEDVIVWNDNIKPLQWSLLGNLGIQLKINSHIGVYAEPGIVYYFDDGSKVQTIRKEKPLNFKMQLGIRWTY